MIKATDANHSRQEATAIAPLLLTRWLFGIRKIMHKLLICLFVFLSLHNAAGYCEDRANNIDERFIKSGTAEWRPFAFYGANGSLSGISIDIFREVVRRTGHTASIELYPVKRLNRMLKTNQLDINIADSRLWNESPLPNFVFTDSYMQVEEFIYFKTDQYIDAKTPEALFGKTIGIVLGYYYPLLEEDFNTGRIRKHEVPSEQSLLRLLVINRVDAAIFDSILFNTLLKEIGYTPNHFRQGLKVSTAPLGIKIRIEEKELVEMFNKALSDMKTDGSTARIIENYTN